MARPTLKDLTKKALARSGVKEVYDELKPAVARDSIIRALQALIAMHQTQEQMESKKLL